MSHEIPGEGTRVFVLLSVGENEGTLSLFLGVFWSDAAAMAAAERHVGRQLSWHRSRRDDQVVLHSEGDRWYEIQACVVEG